jgi:LacI family transcriptional regulator
VVVIGETLGNSEVERLLVEEMLDRQVDGILYATVVASRVELPQTLRKGRTVLLNCVDPTIDLPVVVPDDITGGRMAAEHLLASGVSEVVFVVGEDPTPEATAGRERLEGIVGALGRAGASLAGVVPCAWDVAASFEAVGAWLETGVRPTALICLNDRVAMGAYQALAEHSLRVPDDVAVISFDGTDLASWLRPRLTSLALPFAEMGTRAVEILMDPGWRTAGVTRLAPVLLPGASV